MQYKLWVSTLYIKYLRNVFSNACVWCLKTLRAPLVRVGYTAYPKKYAHGFCFAVLCCGYTLTDFPISIRLTSLVLWQSNDCPSARKATLMNMDKDLMWIHYERLHNHNKAKHNKTVCIILGIDCRWSRSWLRVQMPWRSARGEHCTSIFIIIQRKNFCDFDLRYHSKPPFVIPNWRCKTISESYINFIAEWASIVLACSLRPVSTWFY